MLSVLCLPWIGFPASGVVFFRVFCCLHVTATRNNIVLCMRSVSWKRWSFSFVFSCVVFQEIRLPIYFSDDLFFRFLCGRPIWLQFWSHLVSSFTDRFEPSFFPVHTQFHNLFQPILWTFEFHLSHFGSTHFLLFCCEFSHWGCLLAASFHTSIHANV